MATGSVGFLQPVEGAVAIGGFAQGGGAVARGGRGVGGGFGAVGPAPDDADEEGAQGGEAGGYDSYGGFGGGPDGGGDVVPCDICSFAVLVEHYETNHADGADCEAHGKNSSQDQFLRLASSQTPKNRYRQSKKYKVCSRIDRPGYQEIEFHINTSPTRCGTECASQRVPEIVHGYTLED